MSSIVYYNPSSSPVAGAITDYQPLIDVPPSSGNFISNPNLSAVISTDRKYWKVSAGAVVLMTGPEQASIDAAEAAALTTSQRAGAQAIVASTSAEGKLIRASDDVILSEINTLRQWIVAFKVQVAATTNLANLQTRVAALPDMPDRTLAQAKTAIINELAAGTVD